MSGLKELRRRLSSVKSTEKITTAMKLVASSRLSKAQAMLEKNKPYHELIAHTVGRILLSYQKDQAEKKKIPSLPSMLTMPSTTDGYLLLVFSSDKGLCGGYNQNVAKKAIERINELKAEHKNFFLVCCGKKAYQILRKEYESSIVVHKPSFSGGGITFTEAREAVQIIFALLQKYHCSICEIIHSRYQNAVTRKFIAEQVVPIKKESIPMTDDLDHVGNAYFDFKPSREEILIQSLEMLLTNRIFEAMLHAEASEEGARMMAMDNATDNAQDMIKNLTLKYNTIRQSLITTELTEIISGAEAL